MDDMPHYKKGRAQLELRRHSAPRIIISGEEVDAHSDLRKHKPMDSKFLHPRWTSKRHHSQVNQTQLNRAANNLFTIKVFIYLFLVVYVLVYGFTTRNDNNVCKNGILGRLYAGSIVYFVCRAPGWGIEIVWHGHKPLWNDCKPLCSVEAMYELVATVNLLWGVIAIAIFGLKVFGIAYDCVR